ncbi:MAG: YeeE/YedE family protein [Vicinamibacteraceae bacterium]
MVFALLGGICIGAAAGLVFLLLGRVAGVTGIVADAWPAPHRDWQWRAAFLGGLVTAGAIAPAVAPDAVAGPSASWPLAIVAGLLVGFGARYGGGCTSGHGVCGVGRLSRRSIVGCATFMAVAMIVVFVARHGARL